MVSNSLGHDTITKENFIFATPPNPLKANFMGENKTGRSPLEVQFTDHSNVSVKIPSYPAIDTWLWEFGDGSTSNLQNPPHIYQNPGRYNVTLTVSNSVDIDSKTKDFIVVTKVITVPKGVTVPKKIFIRLA
jgi:PKD repeat protein